MNDTHTKTAAVDPEGYDPHEYPPFALTVDIVWLTIRNGRLSVLLIERDGDPYAGCWALPGGFVNIAEDIIDAAARELLEETNLDVLPSGSILEQLATYGTPHRDPRMRVVTVAHLAFSADAPEPTAGSDARNARWWPVDDLDSEGVALAFDHAQILAEGIARARSKLTYTNYALSFVTAPFTISELRSVYEAVWSVKLDPSNFRRRVENNAGFVVADTGKAAPGEAGGRPGNLYKPGVLAVLTNPIEPRTES